VATLKRKQHVHPLLLASWALLRKTAGANDGVVPASSQRWGDVLAEIDADHFAQVGRSKAFDASAFYEQLAAELWGRGY
jgi:triacylglycerol lipase